MGCRWRRCRPQPTATGDGLLAATLDAATILTATAIGPLPATPTVHLDAGYDYQTCRDVLVDRGMVGQIALVGCQPRSRLTVGG
jgi:predicted RNase H-related nuclease YkuK (DUF458 family)